MIYITTNTLAFPLMLLLWTINGLLFIAVWRLILGKVAPSSGFCRGLVQCTDPFVQAVQHWCEARWERSVATAWFWAGALLLLFMARQVCLHALVSIAGTGAASESFRNAVVVG
jgi:hypothetical protein